MEYRLTRLGESLVNGPMIALGEWIIEYGDELLAAQERASLGRASALERAPGET